MSWLITCNHVLPHGVSTRAMWRFAALYRKWMYLVCEIPKRFERSSPSNFRTQGSFIHINSGKIFERDLLSSDSVAKSATQKPLVFWGCIETKSYISSSLDTQAAKNYQSYQVLTAWAASSAGASWLSILSILFLCVAPARFLHRHKKSGGWVKQAQ